MPDPEALEAALERQRLHLGINVGCGLEYLEQTFEHGNVGVRATDGFRPGLGVGE